jgi:hypothetical protein
MHIIPHNLLSDERMWAHSCCLTLPHRSRTGTTGWGAWRMVWRVRERSRPSSPSQLWVAGPLSPYNVIIYFVQNSCYIVKMWHSIWCHDSSYVWDLVLAHLVIMFAPGSWSPWNPGVTSFLSMDDARASLYRSSVYLGHKRRARTSPCILEPTTESFASRQGAWIWSTRGPGAQLLVTGSKTMGPTCHHHPFPQLNRELPGAPTGITATPWPARPYLLSPSMHKYSTPYSLH